MIFRVFQVQVLLLRKLACSTMQSAFVVFRFECIVEVICCIFSFRNRSGYQCFVVACCQGYKIILR